MQASRLFTGISAVCLAVVLAAPGGASGVEGQSDKVERHVAAARAAAGEQHTRLFDYLCAAPRPRPTRPAGGQPARPAVPDVSEWHAEPAKVFDNLYFLGTRSLNAYAVTTSGGIVIIDPLYDYNVEDEIVNGLTTLGLDRADITHVVISHGHGDHYGGARLLQERYGATVLVSALDWDLIEASTGRQAKPVRDEVMTDGQELSVGDTRITFTHTPGHTPGTMSTLLEVRDGGRSHVAALWGGTAMRPTREFYEEYAAGARKFRRGRGRGCRRDHLESRYLRRCAPEDRGVGRAGCGRSAPLRSRSGRDAGLSRRGGALRDGGAGAAGELKNT